jgi:transposase
MAREKRSDEVQDQVSAPVAAEAAAPPDPEVVARPVKRTFTAAYKQQILREADQCKKPGELGALLRREGLYRSLLQKWREQRETAEQEALTPRKVGRKAKQLDPAAKRVAELERENARLQQRLKQAEAVIDLQKKISEILAIPLSRPEKDGNDW